MNRGAVLLRGGLPPRRPDQFVIPGQAGVAPGTATGIFKARIIVIYGTAPSVTGLFEYSGAPALGNPPQFAVVPPGVTSDPYGNAATSSKILIQGNVITETGGIFRTSATAPLIQLDGPHDAFWLYDPSSNLVASAAPAAGNDGLGDAFLGGVAGYTIAGATRVASALGGGGGSLQSLRFYTSPGAGGPWTLQFSLGVDTAGNLYLTPASTSGGVAVPNGLVPPGLAGYTTYTAINGMPVAVNSVGLRLNLEGAQSSTTTFTVTAAALTQFSNAWTLPANDAVVGATYRIRVTGGGTQGSTAQTLAVGLALGGTNFGGTAVPATFAGAGATFRLWADLEIVCVTTGVTGTFKASKLMFAGLNFAINDSQLDGLITVNTTVSNTFEAVAGWGSTTGAPTVTSFKSIFERLV